MLHRTGEALLGDTTRLPDDGDLLLLDLLQRCDHIGGERIRLGINIRGRSRQQCDVGFARHDRDEQCLTLFDPRRRELAQRA